ALDQRGHGDSEWSYEFDYGRDAHARDIGRLLDHLGLERVAIVGMSMGCINGLRFALDHPHRVSSFTAVDAGPWINTEASGAIVDFVQGTQELESFEAYVERAMAFNPRRHPVLLERSLRHNLRELPNGRWTWKTDWRRPAEFVENVKRAVLALQQEVPQLTCPLLVTRGAESQIFLDSHAEHFAANVPNGTWRRIEGAGHAIQGDQPHALAKILEDFWLGDVRQGRTLSNT
ncbi:MAG: alpha/beta hydrolase, partial [Myxococcota bacterium]